MGSKNLKTANDAVIRKATMLDLDALVLIARKVACDLHEHGIDQWSDQYPSFEHFHSDLDKEGLFVYTDKGTIIGSVTILPENDPFYREIPWQRNHSYVLHRLMVLPERMRQGIGKQLFLHAIQIAKQAAQASLKVDTHPDNYRMQALINRLGFTKQGYIKGMHRIGYELILDDFANKEVDLNVHR